MKLTQQGSGEVYIDRGVYRQALSVAWPAALEGALLSIIGTVDTVMVKQVHPYAIASVSLTSQPRLILLILAQSLCVGTTALVARRRGEDDRKGANDALSLSMLLVTVVGVMITLIGHFLAEPIIRLQGGDADTTVMAATYLKTVSLGFIFNCWNLCLCAGLRATGNTRITMVTNMTANIVNVAMNYCLIGGHFGFPALGVKGAALATAIGGMVASLISFWQVLRPDGYLRLRVKVRGFQRRTVTGLLKVGLSSMAESAFLRIGFAINSRIIADINADALTSNTIISQVTSLSFSLGDGVATAGATLTGISLGERRKDKARGYAKVCMRMGYIISAVLIVGLFFTRRSIAQIFTDNEEVISGASWAFAVVLAGFVPQNARVILSGCLRGAGDVKYVALCSLISVALLRPLLTWALCHPVNQAYPALLFAYTGPWIAFVIDAYVRTGLLVRRVRTGRYLDIGL
ncbi:MAG: MATE family efflux transporter [Clostridia bacterium]|nr:MATE family efflux transporter [Clostridia bacterium]